MWRGMVRGKWFEAESMEKLAEKLLNKCRSVRKDFVITIGKDGTRMTEITDAKNAGERS